MNGLINKAPMLKPFVPFVRTPLNIIKQGFYESTIFKPLGEGVGALKDAATGVHQQNGCWRCRSDCCRTLRSHSVLVAKLR